jgi:hypothetical protein
VQSTKVYIPSSELELSHPPSLASECAPPPGTKGGGGGHTRLRVRGWGSPNSDVRRKSLALCLLCANKGLDGNGSEKSLRRCENSGQTEPES